jgi:hypothetical protein
MTFVRKLVIGVTAAASSVAAMILHTIIQHKGTSPDCKSSANTDPKAPSQKSKKSIVPVDTTHQNTQQSENSIGELLSSIPTNPLSIVQHFVDFLATKNTTTPATTIETTTAQNTAKVSMATFTETMEDFNKTVDAVEKSNEISKFSHHNRLERLKSKHIARRKDDENPHH